MIRVPVRAGSPANRAQLAKALQGAYAQVGSPRLRVLAGSVGVSVSTISRALSGAVVPRDDVMFRLIRALQEHGLDQDHASRVLAVYDLLLQTKTRSATTKVVDEPTRQPATLPKARVCDQCGAVLGDRIRHAEWHRALNEALKAARMTDQTVPRGTGAKVTTGAPR